MSMITRWIIVIVVAFVIASCQRQEPNFEPLNLDSQYDYYNPVWSPTGDAIAFVRRAKDSASSDIWVAHQDGIVTNIVPDNGTRNYGLSWSPDGGTIAYTIEDFNQSSRFTESQIWLANIDGSDNRQLVSDSSMRTGSPLWSPDGRYLAFISTSTTIPVESDLWVYIFEAHSARNLTSDLGDGGYGWMSWLAGSRKLVVFHPSNGLNSIWTIDVENYEAEQIIDNGGYVNASHRGVFLVYIPLEQPDIVRYNTKARTTWEIVNTPEIHEIAAVISPDSKHILIWGRTESGSQLSMYSTTAYQRTTIVEDLCGEVVVTDGVWSPDSERFTFACQDDVNADVWIINRDGSNAINLTGE